MNILNDLSKNLMITWKDVLKGEEKFTSTLDTIIDEHKEMTQNKVIEAKRYSFIENTLREIHLKIKCKSPYNELIDSIYKARDMIFWYPNPTFENPRLAIKNENYCANLAGKTRDMQSDPYVFHSDRIIVGLFLMGKNQLYPAHHHPAWETWVILSGRAEWKVGDRNWEIKNPEDCFTFTKNESHSMKTLDEPLLALWAWTGDLSSWAKWTL